jgi:8-oxo-dGTP pyrophosphatase MutT (NUDIX family)
MPILGVEGREVIENHWVICAVLKNDTILLEQRLEQGKPMYGFVIIPGGKIEKSETIDEACVAESRQEFGITPLVYKKIGIVFNTSSEGSLDFRHVFLITEWKGKIYNREERNIHIYATLEEARDLCKHKITHEILDLIEAELSR